MQSYVKAYFVVITLQMRSEYHVREEKTGRTQKVRFVED
jgi:hypothetical protein